MVSRTRFRRFLPGGSRLRTAVPVRTDGPLRAVIISTFRFGPTTSGPLLMWRHPLPTPHGALSDDAQIVAAVRSISGLGSRGGPDDHHILRGVQGFAGAFEYWYTRVIRNSVAEYRAK